MSFFLALLAFLKKRLHFVLLATIATLPHGALVLPGLWLATRRD